jgi:hypothetical protein
VGGPKIIVGPAEARAETSEQREGRRRRRRRAEGGGVRNVPRRPGDSASRRADRRHEQQRGDDDDHGRVLEFWGLLIGLAYRLPVSSNSLFGGNTNIFPPGKNPT